MWANEYEVEPQAREQLRNISRLPWLKALRVMPDVHLGKGATVGSVIAMKDAVSPSAVGVDIGCGVAAVKTSLRVEDLPESLKSIRDDVETAIPVGFNGHESLINIRSLGIQSSRFNDLWANFKYLHSGVLDRESKAMQQMGSLGGGNHFLEVCSDDEGYLWLTLHSGSRNIGKEIAERHINIAKGLNHNYALPDKDLAVFLGGTPEMAAYRQDLKWAQDYAAFNRMVMIALFEGVVRKHFPHVEFGERISCHHNYVNTEVVDGEELIVTRKGAIRAGLGDLGVIPGSMGTGSYIVRGLGNPQSLWSASHGAGRRMSRSAAKRNYTVDDLVAQTQGIECRKDQGVVDEIPGAYKDINSVIEAQADLVEVVARLQTLLCVKG
jgi:tRNA-splicing ligase RtcB